MSERGDSTWALVTNDDGIAAPGLRALAAGAATAGLDVVVAAPAVEASGASASVITVQRDGRVPVRRHRLAGLDGVPAYGVGGQPAFVVLAALNGWFDRPPALVLSGINYGANLGRAIVHSGTVGAALTAGRFGIRSLAVSLDCDHAPPGSTPYWGTAAALLPTVLALLANTPEGTVLTLNVPDLPVHLLGELRAATLATRSPWQARVDDRDDGQLRVSGARGPAAPEPGSDAELLAAGHPTLTAVRSVTEDTRLPLGELLARYRADPG